jgi:hypothetical protein
MPERSPLGIQAVQALPLFIEEAKKNKSSAYRETERLLNIDSGDDDERHLDPEHGFSENSVARLMNRSEPATTATRASPSSRKSTIMMVPITIAIANT